MQAPDIIHKLVHDPDIFWHFAVEIYGRPGVKESCLQAQDNHGADINLMLLYLWCDCHDVDLSKDTVAALENTSHLWQTEILGPLRAIRRSMKGDSAYQGFLTQELETERRAQRALVACLSGALSGAWLSGQDGSEATTDTGDRQLNAYALRHGIPTQLLSPLLSDA